MNHSTGPGVSSKVYKDDVSAFHSRAKAASVQNTLIDHEQGIDSDMMEVANIRYDEQRCDVCNDNGPDRS